jgi:hypothetical protein
MALFEIGLGIWLLVNGLAEADSASRAQTA